MDLLAWWNSKAKNIYIKEYSSEETKEFIGKYSKRLLRDHVVFWKCFLSDADRSKRYIFSDVYQITVLLTLKYNYITNTSHHQTPMYSNYIKVTSAEIINHERKTWIYMNQDARISEFWIFLELIFVYHKYIKLCYISWKNQP
jgi:hypothetical protein